jgi:hypothetical protein
VQDSSVRGHLIERERIMSLQGAITELQDRIVKLYLDLEQGFRENQLVRDLWSAMAQDVTQQKHSMSAIPHSFWNKLKDEQDGFSRAVSEIRKQTTENKEDQSLRSCFERTLIYEEPTTLRIYVPIIRKLRDNWTDQALDFYIMVKAHLTRITRVTQAFAGDPLVIQRSSLLLQQFEKEVQEPHAAAEPTRLKARAAHTPEKKEKLPAKPHRKALPKHAPALAKHAKSHHGRSKPLVKKIALQPRRARR